MEVQTPAKFEAIFRVCFVLTFVGTFALFFIGHAVAVIHDENKGVQEFLISAEDLQPNFEKSLAMYTENTQDSIDYLAQLRPQDENGYILFISTVENLGQAQGLSLDLQTINGVVLKGDDTGSHYLDYKIQFYGREEQIIPFISALEVLPYFTRVMDLRYETFEFFDSSKDADTPNVSLTLRLYVK